MLIGALGLPLLFLRNKSIDKRVQVFPSETQNALPSSCSFGTRVKTFGRERGSPRAPMSIDKRGALFYAGYARPD